MIVHRLNHQKPNHVRQILIINTAKHLPTPQQDPNPILNTMTTSADSEQHNQTITQKLKRKNILTHLIAPYPTRNKADIQPDTIAEPYEQATIRVYKTARSSAPSYLQKASIPRESLSYLYSSYKMGSCSCSYDAENCHKCSRICVQV